MKCPRNDTLIGALFSPGNLRSIDELARELSGETQQYPGIVRTNRLILGNLREWVILHDFADDLQIDSVERVR